MRFSRYNDLWTKTTLNTVVERITRRNINNESTLPLTISAQYGLINQNEFFNKQIASRDLTNYILLNRGEFAYNKSYSSDYPWGAVKRLDKYDKGVLSSLYICFAPKSNIDSDFLVHYFETPKWYNEISNIAGEGARNHGLLNMAVSDYFNTKHSFPSIQEQHKISQFLNLINQRIDTQSKIIEDLELFEKEINNTIINKLVEHKDLVKFSSIYNFAKEGGTPNTSHPEYYTKGSIPFVKIDDLTTKYLVSNQSFITKLGLENSSAWLIPANSILYSNGATIGAISINKYPVTTKQGILGIVPKSDYLSEYLYYFLRSNYFKKEICKITTQGTMKSAYIKDIDNILVPRINKNQQNEILTLLSEITLKIQKEKDMLELYKKQKAYLLKNMFI